MPDPIPDRYRGLLLVLGVAAVALTVGIAAKSWCGVPAGNEDLYLRWCYSDVPPLYWAERLHEGAVPYLDHPVEYPVLTGGLMWLAAWPASSGVGFFWWTVLLLAGAGLATAALLEREVGWRRALAFAAAPTLAVSATVNWDLPAVLLATLGLVLHRRGRDGWAGIALGLGAATKLFPALFVLPLGLAAWRLRGSRSAAATLGGAVGAYTAVNLPVLVAAPRGWWEFFRLSRERVTDWDALSTVVQRVTPLDLSTPTLNLVLLALFVTGYGALLWAATRWDAPERWHLVALPLLAWFLLTSKVYSPQFSLWLLPLLALAFPGWWGWATFAVADVAVTATRFRYLGGFVDGGLDGAWPWAPFGTALVVRAVVLGWIAWIGWRRAATPPATGAASRRSGLAAPRIRAGARATP